MSTSQRAVSPARFARRLLPIALGLFALVAPAFGQPAQLDLQLAREPAVVTTSARRDFSGLLDGFRDGRLYLRAATGGGEVGYSFAPTEINKLKLPGADLEAQAAELWDRGAVDEAIPLLEALGRQRLRYLPVLNETQRAPLWLLVEASARAGNPLTTISYVNRLRSEATTADQRATLRDAELGAHLALGHVDDTRRLAEAWCGEADTAGATALGWKILAQLAYNAGDFERARWVALQPVVTASYQPMEYLDVCYALAVGAAHHLKDSSHALVLYREMLARGLTWPADPQFGDIGHHYAELSAAPDASIASPEPVEQPPATSPPAPDRNQPLDPVRKIVAPASAR